MTLAEVIEPMRQGLQNSLDELISPRSSSKSKTDALQNIEQHLAKACFDIEHDSMAKDAFIALQHTFECNIPSRLLPWILLSTMRLETLTNKVIADDDRSVVEQLVSQLSLALSLIQGIVLIHEPSKYYLGKRSSLEILLETFMVSRHVPSMNDDTGSKSKSPNPSPHLTSITLDTLLCILVDSSEALREFERANGIQSVVKILKRAGTPREVRMKCLEFLYFYLLDETPKLNDMEATDLTPSPSTAPPSPVRAPKPYFSSTPMLPSSRQSSLTQPSSTNITPSISSSSRSASNSSLTSASSNASASTAASSIPGSPAKDTFPPVFSKPTIKSPVSRITTPFTRPQKSPPSSPPFASAAKFPQLRSMMMLKKDVDYVPQSPKKAAFGPKISHRKSLSTSTISIPSRSRSQLSFTDFKNEVEMRALSVMDTNVPSAQDGGIINNTKHDILEDKPLREMKWKTTEEKKEFLGTMLGNVEALVEGVRKAGVWGLG